jgi:hypothetical protein
MRWAKHYWLWLLVAGALAWWFFTGETPMMIASSYLGRGRQLTMISLDAAGTANEGIDDLVESASKLVGRPVERDALLLAILSGSESGKGTPKEKAAIQRVALNRTSTTKDLLEVLTGGKGLGKQGPRQFATSRNAYELDLAIAESNLAGELEDHTHGAKRFVHKTGFATVTRYAEVCAKWYAESGIVPINVGDVGSLRLFIPEARAKELGYV